jgi:hypothetical protein
MKMAPRTRSLGTKVTEEEYAQIEAYAFSKGLSISEWCRSTLMDGTKRHTPGDGDKVVLAELLALRTILLNLHFAVVRSETITTDYMQAIIDRADQSKATKAAERLAINCKVES